MRKRGMDLKEMDSHTSKVQYGGQELYHVCAFITPTEYQLKEE